jgi:hypothetical protein
MSWLEILELVKFSHLFAECNDFNCILYESELVIGATLIDSEEVNTYLAKILPYDIWAISITGPW